MIEDIIYELNGAKVFSSLDLNMGYHQIELDEESRDVTTFTTHIGTFRYKTLVVGVSSATEEFQHLISDALSGCKGCKNISDDIVVFGKNKAEHDENLEKVLQTLSEKGLTLNRDKCRIGLEEVEYFGFRISANGIQPKENNVQTIKQLPKPTTASEIRSFLGMANVMSRFIENYSGMIAPLTALTKKDVPFEWGETEEKAFQKIKDAISSDKLLTHFDVTKKTDVYTDASPVGLGAILMQEGKVVLYVSRLLSGAETRYCQTEREALGIVWSCERLHMYLHGNTFTVHTDHKPLLTLYGRTGDPSARILRWTLRMQEYHYTVSYVKGVDNPSDYLSRHPQGKAPLSRGMAEEYINYTISNAVPQAIGIAEVMDQSIRDSELTEVRNALNSGQWNALRNTPYFNVRVQLSEKKEILLKDNQIVIPQSLRQRCLKLAHGGHLGITKSKSILRSKVWWPGVEKDIENYIKACPACQSADPGGAERLEPLLMTEPPELPFTTIHVDICGPWPSGDYIISLVDQTTRYPYSDIVRSTTASKVIDVLHRSFSTFGFPKRIVSDNGTQFTSREFKVYCKKYNIEHTPVTPLHPRGNGEIERFFRTTKKTVKCAILDGKDWKTEYETFIFNYRDAKHATTGKAPAELVFGYELQGTLPSLRTFNNETNAQKTQEALQQDKIQKGKIKENADRHNRAKRSDIEVGDKVLLKQKPKNKFDTPYNPLPFTVFKRHGNQLTIVNEKSKFRRNVSQVKKFYTSEAPALPLTLPSLTQQAPSITHQVNSWKPRPFVLPPDAFTTDKPVHIQEEIPVPELPDDLPTNNQSAIEQDTVQDNILETCFQRAMLAEAQLEELDQIEASRELDDLLEFYHEPELEDIFALYRNDCQLRPITSISMPTDTFTTSTPDTSPPSSPSTSPPSTAERQRDTEELVPKRLVVKLVDTNPTRSFVINSTWETQNLPRQAKKNIVYYREDSDHNSDNISIDSGEEFKP